MQLHANPTNAYTSVHVFCEKEQRKLLGFESIPNLLKTIPSRFFITLLVVHQITMSRQLTTQQAKQQQLQQQKQYAQDVETQEHHAKAEASVRPPFDTFSLIRSFSCILPATYRDAM